MTLVLWSLALATSQAAPPEVIAAAKRAEVILDKVDATDAQRAALRRVAESTWTDLDKETIPQATQLAHQVIGILSSETIDATTLEAARRGAVELFDKTSSELLPRAIDAALILTPEQRRTVADLIEAEGIRWVLSPAS